MCLIFLLPSICRFFFFSFHCSTLFLQMRAQFYTLELFVSGPYSTKSYRSRDHPVKKKSSIICTNTHTQYLHGNLRKKKTHSGACSWGRDTLTARDQFKAKSNIFNCCGNAYQYLRVILHII